MSFPASVSFVIVLVPFEGLGAWDPRARTFSSHHLFRIDVPVFHQHDDTIDMENWP